MGLGQTAALLSLLLKAIELNGEPRSTHGSVSVSTCIHDEAGKWETEAKSQGSQGHGPRDHFEEELGRICRADLVATRCGIIQ